MQHVGLLLQKELVLIVEKGCNRVDTKKKRVVAAMMRYEGELVAVDFSELTRSLVTLLELRLQLKGLA